MKFAVFSIFAMLLIWGGGCTSKPLSPEEFQKLKQEGIEKAKKGQFAEAAADLEKAAQSNPEDAVIYRYLAESYEHVGNNDKAIETWQKLIFISPRNSSEAKEGLARLDELKIRIESKQKEGKAK